MSAYGTKLAEGFSSKVMQQVYDRNLLDSITNRNYEGEINGVGSKLNILDFDKLSEQTYANSALTANSITENNGQLVIDTYKSFYWKEKTLAKWLSYIKNPHPYIVTQVANERSKNMDTFVLAKFADVGAGNRVGTDDNDSTTIAITATTGAFTISGGTPAVAGWVGRGIKCVGDDTWRRVKTVTNTTTGFIEDDLDDVDSQYSGGTITTASYVVEAGTAVAITTGTVLAQVGLLKEKLDLAEKNGYSSVSDSDRFLILPPEFFTILSQGTGIALHVDEVFQTLVKKGYMGELQGFKLFKSNRLSGNNTDGYHCLGGSQNWMTFAEKVLDARMEEDIIGDFGTAYKDLFVYGSKVKDINRHQAVELFATF